MWSGNFATPHFLIAVQSFLQQSLYCFFNHLDTLCWFVTFYYVAVAVDEKFGEIPLDVGILVVVGISLREHIDEDFAYLMVGVKTLETPNAKAHTSAIANDLNVFIFLQILWFEFLATKITTKTSCLQIFFLPMLWCK